MFLYVYIMFTKGAFVRPVILQFFFIPFVFVGVDVGFATVAIRPHYTALTLLRLIFSPKTRGANWGNASTLERLQHRHLQ